MQIQHLILKIAKAGLFFFLAFKMLTFYPAAAFADSNWTTFHKDFQRSGVNEETASFTFPLQTKWSKFVGGYSALTNESSPIVVDNKIFVIDINGLILCFDLNTGNQLWQYLLHGMAWAASTYHNGKLYVLDWAGYAYRFDVSNLDPTHWTLDWEYVIGGDNNRASPLIIEDATNGNKLILATWDYGNGHGKVYCLNPDDPSRSLWGPIDYNEEHYSSPALSGNILIVTGYALSISPYQESHGQIHAINAVTGAPLWNKEVAPAGSIASTPVIYNGKVYVGTKEKIDSKLYCLDLATGNVDWYIPVASIQDSGPARNEYEIWSSPTVAYENIYFASYKTLYCISLNDPGLQSPPHNTVVPVWSFTPGWLLFSSPAISQGIIYTGTDDIAVWSQPGTLEDQTFYALNAYNGQVVWKYISSIGSAQTSPVVGQGKVVFVSYDDWNAGLFCFGSKTLPRRGGKQQFAPAE